MHQKSSTGFILFFFFAFLGCQEVADVNDPVIEFIEPAEQAIVNLPDTIDVRVKVTDDKRLNMVTLDMLNEDKIPVTEKMYYYPYSSEFHISTSIVLDNKSMKSGPYQIQVFATDGENDKFKYREIIIKEIPVRIIAYIAVTTKVSFKSTLVRLTPDLEIDSQVVIPETQWLSCVHSHWEKFFFVSNEPSEITAYNPLSFEYEWSASASPPRAIITALFPDDELVISSANGNVSVLSETGAITLQTPTYPDKTITRLAADERFIYAAHQTLNGNLNQLTVYYRVTGAILDQPQFSAPITGLVPLENTLLVFFDADQGTGIMEYNPQYFSLETITLLTGEHLRSVERISSGSMFLLTDRCVILYNFLDNRFDDFTDQPYDLCRFDALNNIVYLVKDEKVSGFALLSGDLVEDIIFNEEVVDFQILYNK